MPRRAATRIAKTLPAFVCILLTSGCVTNPDKAATIAQPKTPIAKTVTNFSQAKRCMDRLFQDANIANFAITSDLIADATKTVNLSTEDMIITAIDDMSTRSKAFSYFTLSARGSSANQIQQQFTSLTQINPQKIPGFFIRGSISQSDNSVSTDQVGGGVSVPWASIGVDKEQVADTISIDLQMVHLKTYSVLPGITTSNTITIVSSGEGANARGLINGGSMAAGLSVSISSRQREGRSQAVRTLMEFSLIELLGKFTSVPYMRCLELPSTDPKSMQFARDLYDQLSREERRRRIQEALRRTGTYAGPVDGQMSAGFKAAVTAAKSERDLVANGRIDFQLFNALFNENMISGAPAWQADEAQEVAYTGRTPAAGRDPVGLDVELLNDRPLRLNSEMRVAVQVSAPARVYCYYDFVQDNAVRTVRVFPNRFEPDNRLRAGERRVVPSPDSRLRLILKGQEEQAIACVATQATYAPGEPNVTQQGDLTPLQCGWPGVECAIDQHQQADTLQTTAKTVTFREGT